MNNGTPRLFGINHSNRDFSNARSWGKNQFNSSFPASLTCFLAHEKLDGVYIILDENLDIAHEKISANDLFGISPTSDELFFAFEAAYTPYDQYLIGTLPRVDLVIQNKRTGICSRGLEVKLTALPDNLTCDLEENQYGTELVIRPDTIVYLACSIAEKYVDKRAELLSYFSSVTVDLKDWTEAENVIPLLGDMISLINAVSEDLKGTQTPIIMQPIWKTIGKSPRLADNCLDLFIWSNIAFIRLFSQPLIDSRVEVTKVNRQTRTLIWVTKMLLEFAQTGQFHHEQIIDQLSYNTKNDKAFAMGGTITRPFMNAAELTKPRIHKDKIKDIILGGGQKLLSPERRFDAILHHSPGLFV